MKFMITLLTFVLSTTLFAGAKVGDLTNYQGTVSGQPFTGTSEVIGYAAETKMYKVKNTTTTAGTTSAEMEEIAEDQMVSPELVEFIIGACESELFKGTLENVSVVAGNFDTCRIVSDDGSIINIGRVPFGAVKLTSPNDQFEVTSFKFGL